MRREETETQLRYRERNGVGIPRGREFRRKADKKEKNRLRHLANIGGPRTGYVWAPDMFDERAIRQVWFQAAKRFCKRTSVRKVRRAAEVANGNQYRKQFDLMWEIW